MENLEQIYKQIPERFECPFATVSNNKATVRVMTMLNMDNNFYFVTEKFSSKFKDLANNTSFEWYLVFKNDEPIWYLRARGNAEIIEDLTIKEEMFNKVDFIKHYWDNPRHPNFGLVKCNPNELEYNIQTQQATRIIKL